MTDQPIQLGALLPELQFKTARSGGAGGQNVNKVESKVEVRFHPASSNVLTDEQKATILERLGSKLSSEGYLIVSSQEERGQLQNKEIALEKLMRALNEALKKKKKRKPTRPSAEAKEKRLNEKRRNAERKAARGAI